MRLLKIEEASRANPNPAVSDHMPGTGRMREAAGLRIVGGTDAFRRRRPRREVVLGSGDGENTCADTPLLSLIQKRGCKSGDKQG